MIPPVKQRITGIDVSKDSLAGCFFLADKLQHLEVSNDKAGFQKLVKQCGTNSLYVMEAIPQIHGIRSVGLVFITCTLLISSMAKERS